MNLAQLDAAFAPFQVVTLVHLALMPTILAHQAVLPAHFLAKIAMVQVHAQVAKMHIF